MEKQTILAEVERLSASGAITRSELIHSFEKGNQKKPRAFELSRLLYYLGAGIVVIGIFIFISEHWARLGGLVRVLVTLGAGVTLYISGEAFYQRERTHGVGNAFHFMAGLLIALGVFVLSDVAGVSMTSWLASILFAILAIGYLVSLWVKKLPIFLFFSIIFSTLCFFSLVGFLSQFGIFTGDEMETIVQYCFLVMGLSYLFIGYSLKATKYHMFAGFLYGFGSVGLLGSAIALSGWFPENSVFWEVIYPFLAFGILYFSIHVKNRTLLIFGTLGLIIYIFKITSEYFTDSFGWSISLVLLGFALVTVGYLAVHLNRKLGLPAKKTGLHKK